jgi:predicted nucleotidyltransferase
MNIDLSKAIQSDRDVMEAWHEMGLAGYVGSIAHGTAGDVIDDIDLMGVYIAPASHYYGLTSFEHVSKVGVAEHYDFALYEIRKYFRLLLKSNPNVISLLWLPENMYVTRSWWGQMLLERRSMFMSKMLYKSFGGYAHAQLQKMTRASTDQAYQGAKRRQRYEQFGYDCKNAAHLIRLLRMGIEALTTGEINVQRHDAPQLKDIKLGSWTLEQVEYEANRLNQLLDEALVKSNLQEKPDRARAERLLIYILNEYFKER